MQARAKPRKSATNIAFDNRPACSTIQINMERTLEEQTEWAYLTLLSRLELLLARLDDEGVSLDDVRDELMECFTKNVRLRYKIAKIRQDTTR